MKISDYLEPEIVATHYNGANFVGSETCMECHPDIYKSHLETAHYNTSAIADNEHVKGSFTEGYNELNLTGVRFKMTELNNHLYQYAKAKFGDTLEVRSKLDLDIGSGVKGQSYLTWNGNELYQLQPSYFQPTGSWVNSPSFPEYAVRREVDDTCLKCHVTFAKNTNPKGNSNTYDREKLLLGIDCQRCHGPLEKHVVYHRNTPNSKSAAYVDDYSTYSRQQRLDACAVCHSGLQAQQIKGNPFSFLAGDTLSLYSKNFRSYNLPLELDVHGNQMGLLSKSACFVNTPKMDCMTCHDPHKAERGNADHFNNKCLTCHNVNSINTDNLDVKHTVDQNCISCHMPLSPSKVMKLSVEGQEDEIPVYIRTHLIGIYD
ncbi:Cytochrome c554 and c-prime [Maribacter sedimenticola]|uniref:Cytochrome c554 and c-prime n=1 Tax=Maribacter sedimenticola TaxID=228956 RepID=A0ABY1SK01_9FLAO|nr:multiheme c-type cytochrome [Maribacter sedimenticola]SNR67521.1 Cytochrome c554 and c-prime [Maribacter sedimenticola]